MKYGSAVLRCCGENGKTVNNMLTIRMASLFFIVLGMSILLPVAVSVALETWGDYSRRLYITMLVSCAGLQAAECVFALQNGAGGGIGVAVFRFSQCLFFILILVLCFCWTLYAYYWFNRRRPGRKTAVLFWLGPLLEVLMILLNPFTGNIYTIGADGSYARAVCSRCSSSFPMPI